MRTVAEQWASFRAQVLSKASPVQVSEMEKAFYVGAYSVLTELTAALDPDAEPTEADLDNVEALNLELEAFFLAHTAAAGEG